MRTAKHNTAYNCRKPKHQDMLFGRNAILLENTLFLVGKMNRKVSTIKQGLIHLHDLFLQNLHDAATAWQMYHCC